jgi:hypothetical protein
MTVEFLCGVIAGAILFKIFHRCNVAFCRCKEDETIITQNPGE